MTSQKTPMQISTMRASILFIAAALFIGVGGPVAAQDHNTYHFKASEIPGFFQSATKQPRHRPRGAHEELRRTSEYEDSLFMPRHVTDSNLVNSDFARFLSNKFSR